MTWVVAGALLLAFAEPVLARQVSTLTLEAAIDEAGASHEDLVALRRQPGAGGAADAEAWNRQLRVRGNEILAEVRRAFVELASARAGLALFDAQAPTLLEMVDTGAESSASGEMGGHDATVFARIATERVTWQERQGLAEIRFNAALGRPLTAAVPALAALEFPAVSPDAEPQALDLDPQVRRRILEARARANAARERILIAGSTLVPQLESAYESARLAYASGHGTFGAMQASYHRLIEARLQHAALSADYDRARIELQIAMGEAQARLSGALTGSARE